MVAVSCRSAGRAGAARAAVAALAVLLPLAALAGLALRSPALPFVAPGPDARWVMAPLPVSARLEQWGRAEVPVTRFERRFAREDGAPLHLRVRALRGFALFVNGALAARDDGSRWRDARVVDATPWLRVGENELRIEVARADGPALLELSAEGAPELASGPAWSARVGDGPPGAAIPADDTRTLPPAPLETPLEAAGRVAGGLALLFALGAGAFLASLRPGAARAARWLPLAGLGAGLAGFAFVFAAKAARIPPLVGFDARHHLYYAAWLREKRALPLATDGWSTYHPPLFYALAAPLLPAEGEPAGALLKLLPFLGGLGVFAASALLARRLFPGDPVRRLLAVAFAAVLPVNLYSACYFSNEPLHAAFAGTALWLGVEAMLAARGGLGRAAALGAALGLAALTKFTALLLLPAAALFVGLRALAVDRAARSRALAAAATPVAVAALLAGWFYARSFALYGDPLLGNWSLPGATQRWWQQPGFHTPAWYAGFGESLVHPYLSGFHSFWDALYSTFWGDGFVAGRSDPAQRHRFWSYDHMSAGYLAALPATALVAAGAVEALRLAIAHPEPRVRAAHGFLLAAAWSVALAFAYLTLRLPFFAQAKAAYLLPLAPALAAWFALGAGRLDAWLAGRGLVALRALFWGWAALFAGTLWLGFAA